ncbi:unnamed protein product [[Candida] boidinii]|uniref:Unnamed protein product n=1 Tax=Candida boidinii TaxID=5477 RepID=A0A9W6WE72_CANBO|nr:unnamed protein product [[Candida] boidinii]GMF26781.1 unnamed protein product [[Candida] boidinii]
MASEFYGKSVLLVDDSIVRGTTSKEIVNMAREVGAKRVYFASCAPVIRFNHIYGIDLADTKALVGYNKSVEEISNTINADDVFYQDLDDLRDCCQRDEEIQDSELALTPVVSRNESVSNILFKDTVPKIDGFEVGVFTGEYITGGEDNYIQELEKVRALNQRMKQSGSCGVDAADIKAESDIAIYNSGDYR